VVTTGRGHGNQPRSGRGRFVKSLETAKRDAEAAQLRAEGKTYDQIAEALDFSDRSLARRAVERALAATVREPADELRQLELIRLDALWVEAVKVMTSEHITVNNGRVIEIDGVPLKDDGPTLSAIDRLLKIMERRAKLVGLDSATKVEVLSVDALDREIAKLTAELGGAEADEASAAEGTQATES
jgi:uncharacterized small protein (DUF1192 family)